MAKQPRLGNSLVLTTVLGTVSMATPLLAYSADTLEGALKESKTKVVLRPRYENVDVEAGSSDAFTLKTSIGVTTGSFYGVSAMVQMDDVTSLKDVDYLDGTNGKDGPAIADPEGTEVNQAFLSYTGVEGLDVRFGRQAIVLDNQRFVGGVAWRQNEQTYDAFSASYAPMEGLSLFAARVSNVNRIFGEQSGAGDHDSETLLFNAGYTVGSLGTATLYHYEIDNLTSPGASNATTGIRFAGASPAGGINLAYELEYADQSEAGDAPDDYSADYYLLSLAGTMDKYTVGLAHEVLGADADAEKGFTTSLATLHKFQGWADQFLTTPGTGIEDTYLTFKAGLPASMTFMAVYHTFSSAEDVAPGASDDYGTEIDMSLEKKFANGASLLFKYADFSAEEDGGDVTKAWVMATYAF